MIKKALNSILVISLGVLFALMIVAPEAQAKDMDHGFFGVTTKKTKSAVLWGDIRKFDDTFKTITITGNGVIVLRTYGNGKKYGLISQKVYEVAGEQTLTFEKNEVYGFSLQLIKNTGDLVRLVQATTTNPLAETVNFFEYEF